MSSDPRPSRTPAKAWHEHWMDYLRKTPKEEVLTVDIASTRLLGVYPLVQEELSEARTEPTE